MEKLSFGSDVHLVMGNVLKVSFFMGRPRTEGLDMATFIIILMTDNNFLYILGSMFQRSNWLWQKEKTRC